MERYPAPVTRVRRFPELIRFEAPVDCNASLSVRFEFAE